jgi:ribulose-5-phosphate 4-epimerase/fuculose-1-phosphate aldolase
MQDTKNALERLAKACRILEMNGHGDLTLGHVSLRDPEGRGFWLKRNRAGLGEIRGAEDFVLVAFSGEKLAGEGGRHSEWPIHAEILKARADVQAVAHTHPLHASVLSGSAEALEPYTLEADYFAELPRHADEAALVTTSAEGAALARSLGAHFAVLMASHGVTFCGTSIEHATCIGVFLEKACRAHLLGRAAGLQPNVLSREIRAKRHAQIMTPAHIEHSWEYFCRMLERDFSPGTK